MEDCWFFYTGTCEMEWTYLENYEIDGAGGNIELTGRQISECLYACQMAAPLSGITCSSVVYRWETDTCTLFDIDRQSVGAELSAAINHDYWEPHCKHYPFSLNE